MKHIFTILLALLLGSASAMAQYGPRHVEDSRDSTSVHMTQGADVTTCTYDCQMKRAGIALLAVGGTLSATGMVLYGTAVRGLDHDAGVAGICVFAAAVPFYVAGSILYVKGKRASLKATPVGIAVSF